MLAFLASVFKNCLFINNINPFIILFACISCQFIIYLLSLFWLLSCFLVCRHFFKVVEVVFLFCFWFWTIVRKMFPSWEYKGIYMFPSSASMIFFFALSFCIYFIHLFLNLFYIQRAHVQVCYLGVLHDAGVRDKTDIVTKVISIVPNS